MPEQGTEGARPDIVGADQPQPVEPLGIGEVGRAGRSVVHAGFSFAQPEIAINTCSRGACQRCLRLPDPDPLRKTCPSAAGEPCHDLARRSPTPYRAGRSFRRRARSPSRCEAIGAQEKTIGAFVCHAREVRAASAGPLRGIAVGIKDIIDTADFPTEMGSHDLQGVSLARRCGRRDGLLKAGGRQHRRQDHDDGLCVL